METVIPKGYRLTIDSWENDGDLSKTVIIDGLSENEINYYVEICKALKGKLGNLYDPSEEELDELDTFAVSLGLKYGEMDSCDLNEQLYVMGLSSEEFHTRMCDGFKVEYLPEKVVLQDVTDKFK